MLDVAWTGEYFLNSEGTTIIQVTHSEFNATYGKRVINLRDGWLG